MKLIKLYKNRGDFVKKARKSTALILSAAVFLFAILAFSHSIISDYTIEKRESTADAFRSSLSSLYGKYDKTVDNEDAHGRFALRRIIVSDYDGKDYGAVDKAVDRRHNFALLQYNTQEDAEKAYNAMIADGHIADPDGVGTLSSYSDRGSTYPFGSNTVGTVKYMNNFRMEKEEVTVALIDTPVMLSHPDLKNRFVNSGYDYSADGLSNADYDKKMQGDYYAHGTFVAGVLADNTMNNVKILPYKVVAYGASNFKASAVIAAINDAVDRGVSVISISLSTASSPSSFRTAVQNAVNKGVCVCVAAGNDNEELMYEYPACSPGAITVSALNKACTSLASYSNYGREIDFCAPGSNIKSTVPTASGGGYDEKSGTSFSAPYLAAVCADIKSMDKGLSRDEVYGILCDFASDLGDKGYDTYYGNGCLNIADMTYKKEGVYSYSLPQGVLNLYQSEDYTQATQPWKLFAPRMIKVNAPDSMDTIGSYSFYNMERAQFNIPSTVNSVGDYAFYGCKQLNDFTFDETVRYVGICAFSQLGEQFVINGYSNTPAEAYCKAEKIQFHSLGCRHNYVVNIVDPVDDTAGYTEYTCTACGDYYIGEYIEPKLIDSGVCGENITYELYDTGRLNLNGFGDMYDYSAMPAPWFENRRTVKIINASKEIRSVSAFAFYDCTNAYELRGFSDAYTVTQSGLYSSDGKTLVLALSKNNEYVMPDSVENLNANAFLMCLNAKITFNGNFTVSSNIVYDSGNAIVMALSAFNQAELVLDDNITIKEYAFILTKAPDKLRANSADIVFEEKCVGYYYDGTLQQTALSLYGYDDISASAYAAENDFRFVSLNSGQCGEDILWHYDLDSKTLTLSGSGAMYYYGKALLVPWCEYFSEIENLVIDERITYLSDYAFYACDKLTNVVMPLSLDAPANDTVWSKCTSIRSITLTLGSGYMADYGLSEDSNMLYTYTPWYLSRRSITDFHLDENVKYIGDYAFRNCTAVQNITLKSCEYIGECAFLACSALKSFTNYSHSTEIADYALFAYMVKDSYRFYAFPVLYAYSDSTAKDYCDKFGCNFEAVGCTHSRGFLLVDEIPSCCFDTMAKYHCRDCGLYLYEEFVQNETKGHYVKGVLKNADAQPIKNADVYIDGNLSAVTNSNGIFVCSNVLCGEYDVCFKKKDCTFAQSTLTLNRHNILAQNEFLYGNYVGETAINGFDYAYARKKGIPDTQLFNFGQTDADLAPAFTVEYELQPLPSAVITENKQNEQVEYRRDFVADIDFTTDYFVTECGFIYGKDMSADMLTLENVGRKNENSNVVKKTVTAENPDILSSQHTLNYGASAMQGTVSARFYIKYSNGVQSYVSYSNINSYTYGR